MLSQISNAFSFQPIASWVWENRDTVLMVAASLAVLAVGYFEATHRNRLSIEERMANAFPELAFMPIDPNLEISLLLDVSDRLIHRNRLRNQELFIQRLDGQYPEYNRASNQWY